MSQFMQAGSIKKVFLLLAASFFLHACCTKKHCEEEYNPAILIKFIDSNYPDPYEVTVFLLDKTSLQKIDSASFSQVREYFIIGSTTMGNRKIELKNYSFLLETDVTSDTITGIDYQRYSKEIKCNNCLLIDDGKMTVFKYKDFIYKHDQSEYSDNDTLVIKRN
ncbi:MAG: hypothetical protein ACK4ND_19945 [Cytophagaceae bacterium]